MPFFRATSSGTALLDPASSALMWHGLNRLSSEEDIPPGGQSKKRFKGDAIEYLNFAYESVMLA
jgi:hypothetical protein